MSEKSEVTILGTSGGIPIEGRAQSGILLERSDTKILFDCGMGIPLRLREAGTNAEEIDYIFLTHRHLDHIQDLPSLTKASWLRTDQAEFTIICPPDMVDWIPEIWKCVGESGRVDLDIKSLAPDEADIFGGLKIEAFDTPHIQGSQGYNINGGKIVYTGDSAPNEGLKDVLNDTELLIHELSLPMKTEIHTDPQGLIDTLGGENIKKLALTHFYPQVIEKIEIIKDMVEEKTDIETVISSDLDRYSIRT
ncbi:MAG: ribonuclease Z [Candidatus Saliniplasma sp.]